MNKQTDEARDGKRFHYTHAWQQTSSCYCIHTLSNHHRLIHRPYLLLITRGQHHNDCSTVAKIIQRFNRTGSTQNRPRHGPPKKLSACAQHHIQRLYLGNRCMSAASIAADVEGMGGGGSACQCSDHTPHTVSNWSAWLSSLKEASSKDDAQESPANSLLKTSRLRTWITGTLSCGLFRPR